MRVRGMHAVLMMLMATVALNAADPGKPVSSSFARSPQRLARGK